MEYGYTKEEGISLVRKGKEGAEEIEAMMKNYRANPPLSLAGSPVTFIKDFAKLEGMDRVRDEKVVLEMTTTSNVLQYFTEDGTKLSIRPSGTEPKIKFYIEVKGPAIKSRDEIEQARAITEEKINAIREELEI